MKKIYGLISMISYQNCYLKRCFIWIIGYKLIIDEVRFFGEQYIKVLKFCYCVKYDFQYIYDYYKKVKM